MTACISSKRKERSAILLICLAGRVQAFSAGRPLSLGTTQQLHQRKPIVGRAPVDVFYLDDKSSEEHTVRTSTNKKADLQKEIPEFAQELVVETTLDELEKRGQQRLKEEKQKREPLPTLSEKDIPAIPTMSDYRKFALPCFGLLLSGPLLSLVDTAFVGLAATNSIELAALGPATTLFDCLTWFLSFLNMATTNLYSSALSKNSTAEAEGVVRTGSRVGLTIGFGVMATLIIFCKPILTAYMGTYYECFAVPFTGRARPFPHTTCSHYDYPFQVPKQLPLLVCCLEPART